MSDLALDKLLFTLLALLVGLTAGHQWGFTSAMGQTAMMMDDLIQRRREERGEE